MKKILVPCEFSEVSMNALSYGFQMFKDASFNVIHVHSGILSKREPVYLDSGMTKDKLLKRELKREICVTLGTKKLPKNIKINIKAGDIIEVINQYTKDNKFDLLLLGTRDKYTLFDKLFGTISLGLVKATTLPVIMVPRFAKFKVIDQILFAIDHEDKTVDKFLNLIENLTIKEPHISFIEIDTSNNGSTKGAVMIKEKLSKQNIKYNYDFEIIAAKEISKSILAVAYNKHSDIIAISPHHQNFIESLLFKSVSKEIILESKMPMLFVK